MTSIFDMIFGVIDYCWSVIVSVGDAIGLNLVAILAGFCIVMAVIRLLLRPFIGFSASGVSDQARPQRQRQRHSNSSNKR